jgi:hypothetical protein
MRLVRSGSNSLSRSNRLNPLHDAVMKPLGQAMSRQRTKPGSQSLQLSVKPSALSRFGESFFDKCPLDSVQLAIDISTYHFVIYAINHDTQPSHDGDYTPPTAPKNNRPVLPIKQLPAAAELGRNLR